MRDHPLPGTKTLLCPKDEHLRELVTGRAVEVILPSRTAGILGMLAIVLAVGMIVLFWVDRAMHLLPEESWVGPGSVFLGLASFHLLVIFSQILSSGRNVTGAWAIVIFYVGLVASVIAEWILR